MTEVQTMPINNKINKQDVIYCDHIFRRGKTEGQQCTKKVIDLSKNIDGKYYCAKHYKMNGGISTSPAPPTPPTPTSKNKATIDLMTDFDPLYPNFSVNFDPLDPNFDPSSVPFDPSLLEDKIPDNISQQPYQGSQDEYEEVVETKTPPPQYLNKVAEVNNDPNLELQIQQHYKIYPGLEKTIPLDSRGNLSAKEFLTKIQPYCEVEERLSFIKSAFNIFCQSYEQIGVFYDFKIEGFAEMLTNMPDLENKLRKIVLKHQASIDKVISPETDLLMMMVYCSYNLHLMNSKKNPNQPVNRSPIHRE